MIIALKEVNEALTATDDYRSSSFPNLILFFYIFQGKQSFHFFIPKWNRGYQSLPGHWEMCLFVASISCYVVMWTLPETDSMA